MPASSPLLADDEPSPVLIERAGGTSPVFLVCDHAGDRIPRKLGNLGVSADDLKRHIAIDIGALAVAQRLSQKLEACLVSQVYSRLVIDSNRPTTSPGSIPAVSERTRIPGNENLSSEDAAERARAILMPYHDAIRRELDARQARGQASVLVAVHSFTPVYMDSARRWHGAVLTQSDRRLGDELLRAFRTDTDLVIGDNEPYAPSDASDYTIPIHGRDRGLLHVGLEIRQDLVSDAASQETWASRIAEALTSALPALLGA